MDACCLFVQRLYLYYYLIFQGETSTFKPYLHRYMTPYLASKSSSPMWYAVRRASAHIIVLSSYSPFGNMLFQLSFFCFFHAYCDI